MYHDKRKHAIRAIVLIVTAMVAAVSFAGCLWAPDLAMVRHEIERQMPGATFDKEIELTLGPISLGLARMASRLVPDARDARGYLSEVRRIELAVYNAESVPPARSIEFPERLKKMQENDDWELAVKIRDDDQLVWVMYRLDDEHIKEVYVVALDQKELVMVHASGKLEALVARALKDKEVPDFSG